MTLSLDTIRHHAKRAPQPGPWRAEQASGGRWVVLDANGMWVCDVGEGELEARHIAACDPQSVIALLDKLATVTKERDDLQDALTVTQTSCDRRGAKISSLTAQRDSAIASADKMRPVYELAKAMTAGERLLLPIHLRKLWDAVNDSAKGGEHE